jgi:AcrR family transcriptional regulator
VAVTRPGSRTERKEQTRARLLQAAAKVFAAKGYFGSAVDDVAEAAGLTKGAVYAHFRTKEALYLALTIERGRRQLAEWESQAAHGGPHEQLAWLAQRLIEVALNRNQIAIDLEFLTYAARDPRLRRMVREMEEQAAESHGRLLEEIWDQQGYARTISGRDMYRLLSGVGLQMAKESLLDAKADLSGTAQRLLDFITDAARK